MKTCKKCGIEIVGSFGSGKYCSRSCANSRIRTDKTIELVRQKLILWNKNNPKPKKVYNYICEKCNTNFSQFSKIRIKTGKRIRCEKCRKKRVIKDLNNVNSILELSSRTVSKIFKKLNIGCCICNWNEASCDVHHINGKKIEDYNNHKNLTYICPNCHRLVHDEKIKKETLISLDLYIGNKWKELYNC